MSHHSALGLLGQLFAISALVSLLVSGAHAFSEWKISIPGQNAPYTMVPELLATLVSFMLARSTYNSRARDPALPVLPEHSQTLSEKLAVIFSDSTVVWETIQDQEDIRTFIARLALSTHSHNPSGWSAHTKAVQVLIMALQELFSVSDLLENTLREVPPPQTENPMQRVDWTALAIKLGLNQDVDSEETLINAIKEEFDNDSNLDIEDKCKKLERSNEILRTELKEARDNAAGPSTSPDQTKIRDLEQQLAKAQKAKATSSPATSPAPLDTGITKGLSRSLLKCNEACPDEYSGQCGKFFSWKKQLQRIIKSETGLSSAATAVAVILAATCGKMNAWIESQEELLQDFLELSSPDHLAILVNKGLLWVQLELGLDDTDIKEAALNAWNCLNISVKCWAEFKMELGTLAKDAGININSIRHTPEFTRKVRNALPTWFKRQLEILALTRGENINDLNYETIENTGIKLWKVTNETPPKKPCGTKNPDGTCKEGKPIDKCGCKDALTAAPATTTTTNKDTKRLNKCGTTKSYDDAPAVPENLRGFVLRYAGKGKTAFTDQEVRENEDRNTLCAQHEVCLNCRRNASEHSGSNQVFKAIPKFITK